MILSLNGSTDALGMHWIVDRIAGEIETHDVFKKGKRGRRQMPVKHQLMTLLHFFGCEGESNSTQRNQFKISSGRCQKHRDRCVLALNSLRSKYSPGRMKMKEKQLQRGLRKSSSFPMQCLSWMGQFYLLGLHQAVMILLTTMGGNMHTL
jgi:hypothetical protein